MSIEIWLQFFTPCRTHKQGRRPDVAYTALSSAMRYNINLAV
jgi:hypothetical protein